MCRSLLSLALLAILAGCSKPAPTKPPPATPVVANPDPGHKPNSPETTVQSARKSLEVARTALAEYRYEQFFEMLEPTCRGRFLELLTVIHDFRIQQYMSGSRKETKLPIQLVPDKFRIQPVEGLADEWDSIDQKNYFVWLAREESLFWSSRGPIFEILGDSSEPLEVSENRVLLRSHRPGIDVDAQTNVTMTRFEGRWLLNFLPPLPH